MSRYYDVYASWQRDPMGFWADAANDIDWFTPWDKVFEKVDGLDRWFVGAECNTCYNAVDRHADSGRGDQQALIYDSPVTSQVKRFTYRALRDEIASLAAALQDFGVVKGDRVIIYMPMVPEAVFAMLACARIGAIHSVVFGGFASHELATRIDDAKPKLILSATCGLEGSRIVEYMPLLRKAMELAATKPSACLILQRAMHQVPLEDGEHDWAEAVARAKSEGRNPPCVPVKATDPLYILYTSGTTGQPKGVVRDNGGHMVALKWSMPNIYGIEPGEVFWAASDVGWVVGHSYIVYAPLLHGATSILYEGKPVGTPDAGAYWRVISQHGVKAMFTAPTAFRAIKKEDPDGVFIRRHDLSGFRTLFLAGERADPDTVKWAEDKLRVPVVDHWWQTETGWSIAANPVGLGMLPVKYGSPSVPMPGYHIDILDEAGHALPPGQLGAVCIKLPLPPGSLPTLWNNDARFRQSYLDAFPGYYQTADAGYLDEDGYVYIMARTDDIINCAGHRLSTGAMEEVIAGHPDVAECAVIGVADPLKGQVPLGFLVLKAGVERPVADIEREVVQRIREQIGPVASFRTAIIVDRLPKTRSGKILRATMRQIADGESWKMPATIDDPKILEEIGVALKGRGLAA
ncbi:propionyl-CoA synthetase [Rhodoligotrophos defluvii]|uniref:propionyl-CoA synthetase n=1 Tax=Rhodoligotrophos defluvii TaxID=2561934 RepID=UPI0010C9D397|nr:propionyl-CoA synthetase [Rhodoligotrophos defluvii]